MVGGDYLIDQEVRERGFSNLTDTGGVIHMNHRAVTEHGVDSGSGHEGKHSGGTGYDDQGGRLRPGGGGGNEELDGGAVRRHSYDFNAMGMHIQVRNSSSSSSSSIDS